MTEAEENMINRIRFVLIDHPNSTAAEIGARINVSRQRVAQAIASDYKSGLISNSILSGNGPTRYFLTGMKARIAGEQQPRNVLADAINALVDPLTAQIRQQLDALLTTFVAEEVGSAIESIQSRVKLRLSESLRAPAPVPGITMSAKHTDWQIRLNARACEALDVAQMAAPVIHVPPAGNFVPKDVVSKRTAHKPAGKGVIEPCTAPAEEAARPPKLTIVGIRTNVQDMIKRDFGKRFDLRLFSPDQLSTIKKAVQPGDDVICLADYISHKHTECVTAAGALIDVVFGGMPSLRIALTERMGLEGKPA